MTATASTPSTAAKPAAIERTPLLQLDHVTVRLGHRTILDEVAFTLDAGEFTGLIGANGAGKTTLFRVILGLQAPTSGRVERVGVGGPWATRGIGYVPQKFLLDPDMPIRGRDLVALGIDGHRLGVPLPSRARRAEVDRLLAAVDATTFADARVGQLSGGEQQRILIAHALAGGPRVLLLDEPLANLDLRSSREVVDLLARLAHDQELAVLISAHELNPLLHAMDRVVYLADGRSVSGTTDEVIRGDVLSALYRHHVDVLHVHGRVIVVAGDGDVV